MTLHVLCHEGREECSTSLRTDDGDVQSYGNTSLPGGETYSPGVCMTHESGVRRQKAEPQHGAILR